jgi:hypothetical protein
MSAQPHGPTFEVGSKFTLDRATFTVTKVGPKMIEAKPAKGEARWFWRTTLANAKASRS